MAIEYVRLCVCVSVCMCVCVCVCVVTGSWAAANMVAVMVENVGSSQTFAGDAQVGVM